MNGPSSSFRLAHLVARREQPARWVFVLAAIPLGLFALIGSNYGAFLPYAVLGLICLTQAVYPTLLVWAVSFAVFACGSALYAFALAQDLFRVMQSHQPHIFLNRYDTTAFLLLLAILIALCVSIWFLRPRPIGASQPQRKSAA